MEQAMSRSRLIDNLEAEIERVEEDLEAWDYLNKGDMEDYLADLKRQLTLLEDGYEE
jgi:hypothetical protein